MTDLRRRAVLLWLPACMVAAMWLWACPVAAASSKALRIQLRAALKQARKATGAPAATATVIRCGKVLWSDASGVKKVGSRRPATPETMFAVASVTKSVTAAIVLKLVERDELSLDTKLSRFYPKLPRAGDITVRMLLDHTSGLNEYFDDAQINQTIIDHPDHRWTRKEVLRGIVRTLFEPGTQYSYSNSAYTVLGGIVEKVTGSTIEAVSQVDRPPAGPRELDLHLSSGSLQALRASLLAKSRVARCLRTGDRRALGLLGARLDGRRSRFDVA